MEILEAVDDFVINKITWMANLMYDSGSFTEQMTQSIFIAIPKITGTLECNCHRKISIMSHITKLILRVVISSVKNKLRPELSVKRFEFLPGRGTVNAIFASRSLIENATELQKEVYLCFIEYEESFDRVKHSELVQMLDNESPNYKELVPEINKRLHTEWEI